jgi:hypothetical protein
MTTAPSTVDHRRRLVELTQGYRITQILYAAVSLNIAEALSAGPRRTDDLAKAVEIPEATLVRLLRALVSLDLVSQQRSGEFTLTESGTLLDGRSPGSVRAGILFEGSVLYQHWSDLVDSIRTGENVYQRRYGVDAWTYRERTPGWGTLFDAAMQEFSTARVAAVVDAYDFSTFGTIVDVGGGRGSLLAGILKAHPGVRGILFDQPAVVANAPAVLAPAGVADRCRVVGGSFFDSVPSGGDAYILSVVIHDWDDEPATAILATCRRAMTDSSRLLLIERVLPDNPRDDLSAYLQDLNMLHSLSGRERSATEFRALLDRSGLRMTRILRTQGPFVVVEGEAASA